MPLGGIVETSLAVPEEAPNMFHGSLDPVFVGLVVVLLAFFFFLYLLVRRTLLGLREGYDQGRK